MSKSFSYTFEEFLNLDRYVTRQVYANLFKSQENKVSVIREKVIERFFPDQVGYCKSCQQRTRYKHDERRFTHFCSRRCLKEDLNGFKAAQTAKGYLEKRGMTQHEFLNQEHVRQRRNQILRSAETKARRRSTNIERLGVDNAARSKVCQAKAKATNIARYGATHHLKTPQGYSRWMEASLKCKDYVTSLGKILKLQGNERAVAHVLESQGWTVRSARKGMHYTFKGKEHVYHPDLVVTKEGKRYVVEVKSEYTLFAKNSVNRNMAKFKAISTVTGFVLIVAFPKKGYMVTVKDPARFSIRELKRVIAGQAAEGVRRVKCQPYSEPTIGSFLQMPERLT